MITANVELQCPTCGIPHDLRACKMIETCITDRWDVECPKSGDLLAYMGLKESIGRVTTTYTCCVPVVLRYHAFVPRGF